MSKDFNYHLCFLEDGLGTKRVVSFLDSTDAVSVYGLINGLCDKVLYEGLAGGLESFCFENGIKYSRSYRVETVEF